MPVCRLICLPGHDIPTFLPDCPRCGGAMRLVAIEPHCRYGVMDTRHFDCACGESFSETVPRHWLGALPEAETSDEHAAVAAAVRAPRRGAESGNHF